MDTVEHLLALRSEGERLADAAASAGLDAAVPTCPDWRVGDLLRHMGDVHRWAAAHVAQRRREPIRDAKGVAEVAGPLPDDDHLLDWFREGHADLVRTLETADPDVECWTFLPAPSARAFWARRQAHETTIHRADAESPSGSFTPASTAFAVDGIDELLLGFLGRGPAPSGDLRTISVRPVDDDSRWLARVGADAADASRVDDGAADCRVEGSASDLYLLLWNRLDPSRVRVEGDVEPLRRWRESVHITWGRPR